MDGTLGDLADDNHEDSADQSSCYLDAGDDDDAAESSAEADGPVAFPNLDDFLAFGEDGSPLFFNLRIFILCYLFFYFFLLVRRQGNSKVSTFFFSRVPFAVA